MYTLNNIDDSHSLLFTFQIEGDETFTTSSVT